MIRAAVVGSLLTLGLVTTSGAAQDAATRLPEASAFGAGWTQITTVPGADELDPAFTSVAGGLYGGPDGARIAVSVYTVGEGMTAIRGSWEAGNRDFDYYRNHIEYGFQVSREDDMAALPLPDGCADARRLYGTDELGFQVMPVGLTLCAADPNILVLTYTSGTIDGLEGVDASDHVTELVLNGATDGTPATGS